MSLQDKIAKRLLAAHGRVLSSKTGSSGWWTSIKRSVDESDLATLEASSTKVVFGDKLAKLVCEIAADDESQIVGLQKYASLPAGHGMVFPYSSPRRVAFHMGSVPFDIDMIFVGPNGSVNKIVSDIEAGSREHFSMSHVSAVIEANAGFCRGNGVEVGCTVTTGLEKQAQSTPIVVKHKFDDKTGRGIHIFSDGAKMYDDADAGYAKLVMPDGTSVQLGPGGTDNAYDLAQSNSQANRLAPFEPMYDTDKAEWSSAFGNQFSDDWQDPSRGAQLKQYSPDSKSFTLHPVLTPRPKTLVPTKQDPDLSYGDIRLEDWDHKTDPSQRFPNQDEFSPVVEAAVKQAQEVFDGYPRKDINPQMVPTVGTDPSERFKDHDIVDNILDYQPMDGDHYDSQIGFDPTKDLSEEGVPPIRSGTRKIKK